jgi:hypothetical protein
MGTAVGHSAASGNAYHQRWRLLGRVSLCLEQNRGMGSTSAALVKSVLRRGDRIATQFAALDM